MLLLHSHYISLFSFVILCDVARSFLWFITKSNASRISYFLTGICRICSLGFLNWSSRSKLNYFFLLILASFWSATSYAAHCLSFLPAFAGSILLFLFCLLLQCSQNHIADVTSDRFLSLSKFFRRQMSIRIIMYLYVCVAYVVILNNGHTTNSFHVLLMYSK